jgi:hypothetical protein
MIQTRQQTSLTWYGPCKEPHSHDLDYATLPAYMIQATNMSFCDKDSGACNGSFDQGSDDGTVSTAIMKTNGQYKRLTTRIQKHIP